MIEGAVVLFVVAAVLAILGISFAVDIGKNAGPVGELATVDSVDPSRTYTFLRVRGKGVALFITVLTFALAAGALVGGIVMLAVKHH
jgi:hypothetical protein